MKSYCEYKKSEWESQFLEYRELDEEKDKANLIKDYIISVEDKETALIAKLTTLKTMLESGAIDDAELHRLSNKGFMAFSFDKHLYNPLIFKDKGETVLTDKASRVKRWRKKIVSKNLQKQPKYAIIWSLKRDRINEKMCRIYSQNLGQ